MSDDLYTSLAQDLTIRYGESAAQWLYRWDSGVIVWSIEMGGLGPAYEQCIQIVAAEILRDLLEHKPDPVRWDKENPDRDANWKEDLETLDKRVTASPTVDRLGITGAQWGAALSLATGLYMRGPVECFSDPKMADRLIQVKRTFP
jgi:hypothetical protein